MSPASQMIMLAPAPQRVMMMSAGLEVIGSVSQLIGVAAVLVWSVVATFVIVKIAAAITGLRVSEDIETQGLDMPIHGETGYHL